MMLTSIAIENFRSFRDRQVIPIKPITLLFGPNNSGKSSILKSVRIIDLKECKEEDFYDSSKPCIFVFSFFNNKFGNYTVRYEYKSNYTHKAFLHHNKKSYLVQTDNSQWKKYGLASLFNFDDDSNSIYLKALRYISSQWGSGVDGSGEVQWKRLAQELENNNSNLKSKLNNWLKKHIGMSINLLPSIERKKKDADDDRYYDYIDFFAFIPLGSKTKLNHYQVGFGISQLIPIIFSSYFYKDRYIFLEQPEAQVHPALQSEIADVFIESAMKRGNTFIIETHSEHLIRRIMRRIRDTSKGNDKQNAITPDDVSIIYVEKKGGQSVVKTIGLDENGELKDRWPGGFFAERYDDIFS